MNRRALLTALAAATIPLGASCVAAAAGSASDLALFGRDPGQEKAFACYTRHYDAAHLASHPQQNVGDMTLFVNSFVDPETGRQYTLELGVHFRKAATLFQITGGCGSSFDSQGTLNCGVDCDGGRIDVNVKNATSLLVSIPDGARTWDPESEEEPSADFKFGSDDKLFRLDKTALKDCLPLVSDDDIKAEITAGE